MSLNLIGTCKSTDILCHAESLVYVCNNPIALLNTAWGDVFFLANSSQQYDSQTIGPTLLGTSSYSSMGPSCSF
jgi:hypothetical protein